MGATANEVYMVELINAERAKLGVAPLAIDDALGLAADRHSDWMLATDTFSHAGANGLTPGDRMADAGYAFAGSWTWGENVAWASTRGAPGLTDEVELNHAGLMDSPGHRANILNASFREIGVGVRQGDYDGWDAAMITQAFARSGGELFVTGVAIEDADGDGAYDVGEGRGGIAVVASVDGRVVARDVTGEAGDYALALGPGTYEVAFGGGAARTVSVNGANVKLDHEVAAAPPPPPPAPPPPPPAPQAPDPLTGGEGADRIVGTREGEAIEGRGGNDVLIGHGGDDALSGGAGNDVLLGGAGADVLDGGAGRDTVVATTAGTLDLLRGDLSTGHAAGDRHVSIERAVGSQGADVIRGTHVADTLDGRGGDDVLNGRGGNDALFGAAGDDMLIGGAGADVLHGGAGRDTVVATKAGTLDLLRADLSTGHAAGDRHVSIERAVGSRGDDVIRGTGRADTLEGRAGADTLNGRYGDDVLRGGAGNDMLIGGAGTDVLGGGAGRDLFVVGRAADSKAGAGDRIVDFQTGLDRLHLRGVDANEAVAGNQALRLVNAFTGAGGEVTTNAGLVAVDLDGDGTADLEVRFDGGVTLDAGDLVL